MTNTLNNNKKIKTDKTYNNGRKYYSIGSLYPSYCMYIYNALLCIGCGLFIYFYINTRR